MLFFFIKIILYFIMSRVAFPVAVLFVDAITFLGDMIFAKLNIKSNFLDLLDLLTNLLKLLLVVAIWFVLARLFCNINTEEAMTWYNGIWHGLFFPENFIMSLFSNDVNFILNNSSGAYFFWFIISSIISILLWLF